MKNGRENRNNGNQEKGKEEKETLGNFSKKSDRGREMRPLSFLGEPQLQKGIDTTRNLGQDVVNKFPCNVPDPQQNTGINSSNRRWRSSRLWDPSLRSG